MRSLVQNDPGYSGTLTTIMVTVVKCNAGTYADNEGLNTQQCFLCEAGKYGNELATVQTEAGPDTCTVCGIGKYQDIPGSTTCKECPDGTNALQAGQVLCTPNTILATSFDSLKETVPMVDITVKISMSAADFDAVSQNNFRLAISRVTNVPGEKIFLLEIDEVDSRREAKSVQVRFAVQAENEGQAQGIVEKLSEDNINGELEKVGLPKCTIVSGPEITDSNKIKCESFSTCEDMGTYFNLKMEKYKGLAGGAIAAIIIGVFVAVGIKFHLYTRYIHPKLFPDDDRNKDVDGKGKPRKGLFLSDLRSCFRPTKAARSSSYAETSPKGDVVFLQVSFQYFNVPESYLSPFKCRLWYHASLIRLLLAGRT